MEPRRVLRRHLEMDRLNSQRVRAYLQSAKIQTDILTYAIWWRLFTKAPYTTTSTRIYSPVGDQGGNQTPDL